MLVAFDIGGTFTDIIIVHTSGPVEVVKLRTALDDIGEELANIIDLSLESHDDVVDRLVHATTICSNSVIEQSVARTGLITTKGFRDVLEMMGQRGPSVYAGDWDRLRPLVPRQLRREISERVLADGTVEVPLIAADVVREGEFLVDAGVEVIAVCLLNSYLNSEHELAVEGILNANYPDMPVCLSSDVHPEVREYERTSTTVINAALVPVVGQYLDNIEKHLARHSQRMSIMQSNGGTMVATVARERPMTMIESGPAAGVLGAARLAAVLNLGDVLSFDMGGTTAKACLIEDGQPAERPGTEIGGSLSSVHSRGDGHVLRAPSIDIVEVGAGGGSIAWIDEGRALRVGPVSAGADPGPVCYGRGGMDPTVTDANVVLGYINQRSIASGKIEIDPLAARNAIERSIAKPLGLDVLAAARGIVDIANATMVRALRAVSTERGHDIRTLDLIAFGGGGPLHAADLCDRVGAARVIVPPHPGVFSAIGLLLADTRLDYLCSVERPVCQMAEGELEDYYEDLEVEVSKDCGRHGLDYSQLSISRSVDLRYAFQQEGLTLDFPHEALRNPMCLEALFTAAYEREYGYTGDGNVNIVNLRVRACTRDGEIVLTDLADGSRSVASVGYNPDTSREVSFDGTAVTECKVRQLAEVTGEVEGPVIIEESNSTIMVPPGWVANVDQLGVLLERSEVPA